MNNYCIKLKLTLIPNSPKCVLLRSMQRLISQSLQDFWGIIESIHSCNHQGLSSSDLDRRLWQQLQIVLRPSCVLPQLDQHCSSVISAVSISENSTKVCSVSRSPSFQQLYLRVSQEASKKVVVEKNQSTALRKTVFNFSVHSR